MSAELLHVKNGNKIWRCGKFAKIFTGKQYAAFIDNEEKDHIFYDKSTEVVFVNNNSKDIIRTNLPANDEKCNQLFLSHEDPYFQKNFELKVYNQIPDTETFIKKNSNKFVKTDKIKIDDTAELVIEIRNYKNDILISEQKSFVKGPAKLKSIKVYFDDFQYKYLKEKTNTEYLNVDILNYNNSVYLNEFKMKIRGNTSKFYQKRPYKVKLANKKININNIETNEFYLLSYPKDKGSFRSYFAFNLLKKLKLFYLEYTPVDFIVNGISQGVYLLIETHKNGIKRNFKDANIIFRQGPVRNSKNTVYYSDKLYKNKIFQKAYASFKVLLSEKQTEKSYERIKKVFNLEKYFDLVAFHDYFRNTDYIDEIFIMGKITKKQVYFFNMMPWDIEDYDSAVINNYKDSYAADKLVMRPKYSPKHGIEDALNRNQLLYHKYLENYKKFLHSTLRKDIIEQEYELLIKNYLPIFNRADLRFFYLENNYFQKQKYEFSWIENKLIHERNFYVEQYDKKLTDVLTATEN